MKVKQSYFSISMQRTFKCRITWHCEYSSHHCNTLSTIIWPHHGVALEGNGPPQRRSTIAKGRQVANPRVRVRVTDRVRVRDRVRVIAMAALRYGGLSLWQGHPRSLILEPIETAYATSY